jgi:hypothetical protein
MTYPLIPTVFMIDMAAGGASDIIDTQPNLVAFLKVYLSGGTNPDGFAYPGFFPATNANLCGGDWSVAWGPCVYVGNSPGTATNAMYVAFSPSRKIYVVAIAATNAYSVFDWIFEDGNVDPHLMTQWPPKLPFVLQASFNPIPTTTPAISAATATGISDLLTRPEMLDPSSGSLQQFLTSKTDANTTLIFAGHSLAGALSPSLAFYLYPTPAASGWKNVLVLPSAGATPGNNGFAAAFAAAFPQQADTTSPGLFWNIDYANNNDVVPHAWDKLAQVVQGTDSAGNYPSIWGVLSGPLFTIGAFVSAVVKAASRLADNYYSAIPQSWVTPAWGTYNGSSWSALPTYTDTSPLSTVDELAQVIEATHINQYFNYFGVTPPPPMSKSALKTVTPKAALLGQAPATS